MIGVRWIEPEKTIFEIFSSSEVIIQKLKRTRTFGAINATGNSLFRLNEANQLRKEEKLV